MLRNRSFKLLSAAALLVVLFALSLSPAFAATVFTGVISAPRQIDNYSINIPAGRQVFATEVCDEISPGNRPLDPVLIAYDPNGTQVAYGDDSFNSSVGGVDCNSFASAGVSFITSVAGQYTFAAQGFGSATGPYTLTINVRGIVNPFDDGRVNNRVDKDEGALVAVYCTDDGMDLYGITPGSNDGTLIARATQADIDAVGIPSEGTAVIVSASGATLSRASNGQFVLSSSYPDGKPYVIAWTDCDSSSVYDISN